MTSEANTGPAGASLPGLRQHGDSQSADIDAAVKRLGADRDDIEQLIAFTGRLNPGPQQVSGLLRRAYARLGQLRAGLAENYSNEDGTSLEIAIDQIDDLLLKKRQETGDASPNAVARWHGLEALHKAVCLKFQEAAACYRRAAATPGLDVESQWRYQCASATVIAELGRETGDNAVLEQAATQLREQALPLVSPEQTPCKWATTKQLLGDTLGALGQRQGGTRNLENAITELEASLSVRSRTEQPLDWAETQNSLGNALGTLGHRLGDEEMLNRSITAFELALEERTPERAPHESAVTRNNLAAMLQSMGQRNKDSKMLKRAVDAYKEVLVEWTRDTAPLDWATTMDNLGTALRLLGEQRKGSRTLEQSVAAYQSALSERSRQRLPQQWAMTQNNLGAALQKLAEREENAETLEQAITSYQNALQEWTRDRAPMAWAMTMANLAVARRNLAQVTDDLEQAGKAVTELELVADVFREASHAQYSELSIDELGKARKLVDELSVR